MLNFLISIVVFAISTFLLAVAIRYGMRGAERFDSWLLTKSGLDFTGFNWYYRIPFAIGVIPEYFYAMVLGHDNYFKYNWWALKTASFISVLLFVAMLQSRGAVASYFSLSFLGERGVLAFFTSGTFIWFLNFITLMYAALAIVVIIESIKLAGVYAPLRVLFYGFHCFLMANLTVIVLTVIVFISIIYLIYKVIKFLFFSNNRKRKVTAEAEDESAGEILNKGFSGFKVELEDWEANRKTTSTARKVKSKPRRKPVITRKKRPVTHKEESINTEDDIPRLHPD